jgi:hypothetical protein
MKDLFNSFPTEHGTREDSLNYIKVLQYVANVDGIDATEKKGIENLISLRGWDPKIYNEGLESPMDSISKLPYNSDTIGVFSHYIIRDCVLVAYIEGGYSSEEKRTVLSIANEIGVSAEKLKEIEEAVFHYVSAIEKWSPLI